MAEVTTIGPSVRDGIGNVGLVARRARSEERGRDIRVIGQQSLAAPYFERM